MKGWKTITVGVAVLLLGILQMPELSNVLGGCVFDQSAMQPETCVVPAWLITAIGGLMIALRFITTSSVFKADK